MSKEHKQTRIPIQQTLHLKNLLQKEHKQTRIPIKQTLHLINLLQKEHKQTRIPIKVTLHLINLLQVKAIRKNNHLTEHHHGHNVLEQNTIHTYGRVLLLLHHAGCCTSPVLTHNINKDNHRSSQDILDDQSYNQLVLTIFRTYHHTLCCHNMIHKIPLQVRPQFMVDQFLLVQNSHPQCLMSKVLQIQNKYLLKRRITKEK